MNLDEGLLLVVIAVLLVLSVVLVLPYVQFVVAAVLAAFVLRPVHDRLTDRVGPTASAAALVVASVFALVVPVVVLIAFVAGDALRFARRVEELDPDVEALEDLVLEYTGEEVDVAAAIRSSVEGFVEGIFGEIVAVFGMVVHLAIGLGLFLFLLFFFVRDGDRFLDWLRSVAPMPRRVTDDLLTRTGNITRAVLVGHVLVAVVQGVIAGVGLAVAGIPNAAFWTFVMILLALIPLIGTFVVWAPASAYLVWSGAVVPGVALFVYGAVVVGISDEYLRPIVVDRYASVSPGLIILGVIGGLSVFGFMGLFVGPIVVGVLKGTVEVFDEHYGSA